MHRSRWRFNMVSLAVCRRIGLVFLGIALGLTLAVWRGVIKPPATLMSAEWSPGTVIHGTQRTFPDIDSLNISQAEKETIRISSCVSNFASFRAAYNSVNRPKMEIDRVESHSYLTTNSRVLEVGGYTGVDADKLIKRYNPYYLALEPVPRYYKILEKRFKDNPKYKLFKFGLGRENKTLFLNIDSDATSLFRAKQASSKTKTEEAHIHEITGFFKHIGMSANPIDLITINCEGCEFELLELITASEIVKYLKNIQFQFHLDLPGITNQEARYCGIMTLLSRTHRPTFQYSYIWQSWRLKI
ncbi:uncharacterized protein LOC124260717 isoform X1 [Haliotis rubra]|uniref:uncharacterized protein LOC124260717 isoform X1 n=2 Tax=Haliotis rubra TaxID=36100 RepID=UPI001EE539DE|nr:uncharacterized protein LOC124260717 isoform X1 [Haliotis rubra]